MDPGIVDSRIVLEFFGRNTQENYWTCHSGSKEPGNDQAVPAIVAGADKNRNLFALRLAVFVQHNLNGPAAGIFHQFKRGYLESVNCGVIKTPHLLCCYQFHVFILSGTASMLYIPSGPGYVPAANLFFRIQNEILLRTDKCNCKACCTTL